MAAIHLESMMYRDVVWVPGPSLMTFALIKLVLPDPVAAGAAPPPVNVALVLDVSGSMYETDQTRLSRLERVQRAAVAALDQLRATDRVAVIAFGKTAQTVLPSRPLGNRDAARTVIERIDTAGVEAGGTAMHQGIGLALDEVQRYGTAGQTNAVVVLTDGETAGEPLCRQWAETAAGQGITISTMGIGLDWNEVLLKDLSRISGGHWSYIDVHQPDSADEAFRREFAALSEVGLREVTLEVQPMRDIRVKRGRQVAPEIRPLPLDDADDRGVRLHLGAVPRRGSAAYMLDLSIPPRPAGKFILARVQARSEPAGGGGAAASSEGISLEVTYSPDQESYVNAEVARHLDEIQIDQLNRELQTAIAAGDRPRIHHLAANLRKTALRLGPAGARKTQLAHQVLREIEAEGRVSRTTQLAMDDRARRSEAPAEGRRTEGP